MDFIVLALVFAAAASVSFCVVLAFSAPMDKVLFRLISGEMAEAWSQFTKFALFVSALAGGLRLGELGLIATPGYLADFTSGRYLLEVFKSIVGALSGASGTLLVFFGATLTAYAGTQIYALLKPQPREPRVLERPSQAAGAGRL